MQNVTPIEELESQFNHEVVAIGDFDSDQRWVVGELANGRTVVGNAKAGELCEGCNYRFLGKWVNHPKYGKQFKFSSFCSVEPKDEFAIQRYLEKTPGIGAVKAASIVGAYGQDSLAVCREDPEKVSRECQIDLALCRSLSTTLEEGRKLESLTIDIENALHGFGFPKDLPRRLMHDPSWGEDTVRRIRENPFDLLEFKGCGFLKCDALWLKLGLPKDDIRRQVCCAVYRVTSDMSGSTWIDQSDIWDYMVEKLSGYEVNLDEALRHAVDAELLVNYMQGEKIYWSSKEMADDESSYVSDLAAALGEGLDEYGL